MKKKKAEIINLEKKRTEITLKKLMKILRIPVVILVVIIAVFLSVRLMGNVAVSNITDGLRQVKTLFIPSDGYPYPLDDVELNRVDSIGSDIIVVDEKTAVVLDSAARKRNTVQLESSDSKIISKNGRALIYGNSSSVVTLISKTEVLGTVKTEKGVVTAALASDGTFAVSYPTEKVQSVLTVYDNRFGTEFQWNCSNERIAAIDLSDNGKKIAVAAIGATNAEIYTRFLIFDTGDSQPIADIKIAGTMIYKTVFTSSEKIIAIGDNKTVVYNAKGEAQGETAYAENSVSAIAADSDGNTVVCLDEYGGAQSKLIVYKANGKLAGEIVVNGVPEAVDISENRVAVALGSEIIKYSFKGKELKRFQSNAAASNLVVTSGSVYSAESGYIRKYK